MPDVDLGPKDYRWTSGPRHWRKAARARKLRDGTLLDSRLFRGVGFAAAIWFGSVVSVARYIMTDAPLWPTVFISVTPFLIWLAVTVWDDTA